MPSQSVIHKKGTKKGRYKPLSKRKKATRTRIAKENIRQRKSSKIVSGSPIPKHSHSKLKIYPGIFLNDLEPYKKHGNRRHFRRISEILELRMTDGTKRKWQSALVLTFVTSTDLINQLTQEVDRTIIVLDGFQFTNDIKKVVIGQNLIYYYSVREMGKNIPSSFHPKLIILQTENLLRVVIGSGNFVSYDWNKCSNVFWSNDFIRKNDPSLLACDFEKNIEEFCSGCLAEYWGEAKLYLGLDLSIFNMRNDYYRLITSLPTSIFNKTKQCSNLPRITQILMEDPPKSAYTLFLTKIIYITSSINTIDLQLMFNFASAIFGSKMPSWDFINANKGLLLDIFRVIYPTKDFVKGAYFGEEGAKCLFLTRREYDRYKFEKSVLRKYQGNFSLIGSQNVMPHLKVFVIANDALIDDDTSIYLGSHNFTKAAWGHFQYREKEFKGFNFELGLIIPPRQGSARAKKGLLERIGIDINAPDYCSDDLPFFSDDLKFDK